jgi:ppGpp synthetase/RelA/SpoT-type nucleotidyltranferase
MARQKRCFLSSPLEDLRLERLAVKDAIERAGLFPVMMESFTTDSRPPAELLADMIDSSSEFLLVLGARLGSRDRISRKYFVQLEYDRAIAADIQVHIFLSGKDRLIPEGQHQTSRTEQKELARFRDTLQAQHTVRVWSDAEQLKQDVFVALNTRRTVKRRVRSGLERIGRTGTAQRTSQLALQKIETTGEAEVSPLSPVVGYVDMVSWYESNLFAFDEVREQLERHVRSILLALITIDALSDYTVYSRTKKPVSLQDNFERPRSGRLFRRIEDVHDLIGLRVVVLHESEVSMVANELLARLPGSTLEVKEPADPLSFGYKSYHVLSPFDGEIAGRSDFRFEVQIRTFLQHTWAQIEHRLGYKAPTYDSASRRLFAQVSALLEIADGKFSELKTRQPSNIKQGISSELDGRQRADSQGSECNISVLTEKMVLEYFSGGQWDSSMLLNLILQNQYAFSVTVSESGGSTTLNWIEPLLLLDASKIQSLEALHTFFENHAARLSEIVVAIGTRIEFTSVTPLLLLWIAALTSHADGMANSSAAEIRALLEQYALFPEDDRDAISDHISMKTYFK